MIGFNTHAANLFFFLNGFLFLFYLSTVVILFLFYFEVYLLVVIDLEVISDLHLSQVFLLLSIFVFNGQDIMFERIHMGHRIAYTG
jgi:hypothetical protein